MEPENIKMVFWFRKKRTESAKHAAAKKPLTRIQGPRDPKLLAQGQKILSAFIGVYCRKHHAGTKDILCEDCKGLLNYALERLSKCPYDPKPKCKVCPTHCYKPEYRRKIKEVMRFSGMYYIKRGRVDWLIRYFLSNAG